MFNLKLVYLFRLFFISEKKNVLNNNLYYSLHQVNYKL